MSHAVSIVIIARNEEAWIESCIRSVVDASQGLDAEVILVDSASEDRTVAIAEELDVKILRTPREPKAMKSPYGVFMIRANVLREVGSFDPRLKANEEGELSDRILAAGYRVMLLPHLSCFPHVTGAESFLPTLWCELSNYVTTGRLLRCSFRNRSPGSA